MSGPWPQIIICTNFSSLALLANCSSSDKSPPLQARQPTLLHLWLSFSQTREILRRGAKTRYNASCERVNGAGTPRGEGGCYVRSYVVTRKEGECGGGGDHTGETLYNVRTNLRWEEREPDDQFGGRTLSSSGDARRLPGKQSTVLAPRLSDILLSAPLPPSINFRVARCLIVSCKIKAISSKHLSRYSTCCLAWLGWPVCVMVLVGGPCRYAETRRGCC